MTTLPNPFLSAASLQPVAETAASSPLSSLSEAAVTPIQSSCSGENAHQSRERCADNRPAFSEAVEVASDLHDTEAAVSHRTAAASDLDQLANYFRRHPPSLRYGATSDSRFVPDKAAMWDAMFNEAAPRAVLDPIWADDAPLFLRTA